MPSRVTLTLRTAQAGKRSGDAVVVHARSRQRIQQSQNVVADDRQGLHFLFGEHVADRGTRGRQQRVHSYRDFDRRCYRSHHLA